MMPANALVVMVSVASLAVFILIVLEKWKFIEYLQLNARRFFGPFHGLPDCNFCLLFWFCFIISIPLAITSNLFYITMPFIVTPIAKAIYENCRTPRIK